MNEYGSQLVEDSNPTSGQSESEIENRARDLINDVFKNIYSELDDSQMAGNGNTVASGLNAYATEKDHKEFDNKFNLKAECKSKESENFNKISKDSSSNIVLYTSDAVVLSTSSNEALEEKQVAHTKLEAEFMPEGQTSSSILSQSAMNYNTVFRKSSTNIQLADLQTSNNKETQSIEHQAPHDCSDKLNFEVDLGDKLSAMEQESLTNVRRSSLEEDISLTKVDTKFNHDFGKIVNNIGLSSESQIDVESHNDSSIKLKKINEKEARPTNSADASLSPASLGEEPKENIAQITSSNQNALIELEFTSEKPVCFDNFDVSGTSGTCSPPKRPSIPPRPRPPTIPGNQPASTNRQIFSGSRTTMQQSSGTGNNELRSDKKKSKKTVTRMLQGIKRSITVKATSKPEPRQASIPQNSIQSRPSPRIVSSLLLTPADTNSENFVDEKQLTPITRKRLLMENITNDLLLAMPQSPTSSIESLRELELAGTMIYENSEVVDMAQERSIAANLKFDATENSVQADTAESRVFDNLKPIVVRNHFEKLMNPSNSDYVLSVEAMQVRSAPEQHVSMHMDKKVDKQELSSAVQRKQKLPPPPRPSEPPKLNRASRSTDESSCIQPQQANYVHSAAPVSYTAPANTESLDRRKIYRSKTDTKILKSRTLNRPVTVHTTVYKPIVNMSSMQEPTSTDGKPPKVVFERSDALDWPPKFFSKMKTKKTEEENISRPPVARPPVPPLSNDLSAQSKPQFQSRMLNPRLGNSEAFSSFDDNQCVVNLSDNVMAAPPQIQTTKSPLSQARPRSNAYSVSPHNDLNKKQGSFDDEIYVVNQSSNVMTAAPKIETSNSSSVGTKKSQAPLFPCRPVPSLAYATINSTTLLQKSSMASFRKPMDQIRNNIQQFIMEMGKAKSQDFPTGDELDLPILNTCHQLEKIAGENSLSASQLSILALHPFAKTVFADGKSDSIQASHTDQEKQIINEEKENVPSLDISQTLIKEYLRSYITASESLRKSDILGEFAAFHLLLGDVFNAGWTHVGKPISWPLMNVVFDPLNKTQFVHLPRQQYTKDSVIYPDVGLEFMLPTWLNASQLGYASEEALSTTSDKCGELDLLHTASLITTLDSMLSKTEDRSFIPLRCCIILNVLISIDYCQKMLEKTLRRHCLSEIIIDLNPAKILLIDSPSNMIAIFRLICSDASNSVTRDSVDSNDAAQQSKMGQFLESLSLESRSLELSIKEVITKLMNILTIDVEQSELISGLMKAVVPPDWVAVLVSLVCLAKF